MQAREWIKLDQLKIKKKILKINFNIFIFYITSIIFYYYLNKKITTKQKILFFYIKYFYFFFFSHQSNLLQYQSTFLSSVHCQTQPISKYNDFTFRCENVTLAKTKLLIKNLKSKTIFTLILHQNDF